MGLKGTLPYDQGVTERFRYCMHMPFITKRYLLEK